MKIEILNFDIKGDERGRLIALETGENIPFDIKRVYYIYATKDDVRRGFHAHKQLDQIAVCIKGSCNFLMDDGKESKIVEMNEPSKGLMIPKMIWHEMYNFSADCVLLVIASDLYSENDYIRSYKEFKEICQIDKG